MIKFEKLEAGTLTVTNKSKKAKYINIYVPNKDSMPYEMAPEATFTITTTSAGETYFYLAQNSDVLEIKY